MPSKEEREKGSSPGHAGTVAKKGIAKGFAQTGPGLGKVKAEEKAKVILLPTDTARGEIREDSYQKEQVKAKGGETVEIVSTVTNQGI